MTDALLALSASGLLLIVAVLFARHQDGRRWQRELVAYRLAFPRDLDPKAVAAFLAGLSGLAAPRWQQPFVVRAVVFETTATSAGITHHLLVSHSLALVVLSHLRAALPNVSVSRDEGYQPAAPTLAGELGLSSPDRSLRVDQPETVVAALLASLQPLRRGEQAVVQWVVGPVGPVPSVRARSAPRKVDAALPVLADALGPLDGEALKAARTKRAVPLFQAVARLGVAAAPERAPALLQRMSSAFHTANAPGAHLYRRHVPASWSAHRLSQRSVPLLPYPCVLNAVELAALVGFPLAGVQIAGLTLGGTRQLAPSADIPTHGRIVAHSTFPGMERPLALSAQDALRHLHVIGPTGVGKSTLLLGLISQDMAAGRGIVVVDPKGDLVSDVLDRVPAHRVDDVVVLDPADEDMPVGLNLLAGAVESPELVVDQVVGIFHQLYRAFWGPRTDDILRSALLTLATRPGMTLCEVPLLLTDAAFRRRLVSGLDDPIALEPFWGWYEGISDAERAAAIGPVMNKLRAFTLRRRIRNVIGQAEPRLDVDRVLSERRILLVPLTKGLLGEEAAALLGSLLVARLWWAVMRRAGLPPQQRHAVLAYIDEFQDYLNLPTNIGGLLAQARGLGLGLTLAHQHLGQLPPTLRDAVLANARSRVIFQTAASDARVFARELAPHLTAAALQGLGPHHVVVTLAAGARIAQPATGVTLPPPPATGQAAAVRAHSRERYGRARSQVEAAIRARHGAQRGPGSVGRRTP